MESVRLPTIGITGARGFVGRGLAQAFAQRGHRVVGFSRNVRNGLPGIEPRAYDLDTGLSVGDLADIDVLIHGAFLRKNQLEGNSTERNVRGTCSLFKTATEAGTKFVFLSTLSARPDARSEYGIHKYAIEATLTPRDVLVIRPGLVVGDGGLIRQLYSQMCRGFIPLIDGGAQLVQVIGIDDLATALLAALENELRGSHVVCSPESVSIAELARTMATRFGRHPRYVSVPSRLAIQVARAAERLRIRLPLTSENLLGLQSVVPQHPSVALMDLGWRPRAWLELVEHLSFAVFPAA